MLSWVIGEQLARSSRPGYQGERGMTVSRAQVDGWLSEVRHAGIRSIICLLADDQLSLYSELRDGLVAYYRDAGFTVEHIPARDHQSPPLPEEALQKVWSAFQQLPKPVLVHCSAGVDRTGLAVKHIQSRLKSREA